MRNFRHYAEEAERAGGATLGGEQAPADIRAREPGPAEHAVVGPEALPGYRMRSEVLRARVSRSYRTPCTMYVRAGSTDPHGDLLYTTAPLLPLSIRSRVIRSG